MRLMGFESWAAPLRPGSARWTTTLRKLVSFQSCQKIILTPESYPAWSKTYPCIFYAKIRNIS